MLQQIKRFALPLYLCLPIYQTGDRKARERITPVGLGGSSQRLFPIRSSNIALDSSEQWYMTLISVRERQATAQ